MSAYDTGDRLQRHWKKKRKEKFLNNIFLFHEYDHRTLGKKFCFCKTSLTKIFIFVRVQSELFSQNCSV